MTTAATLAKRLAELEAKRAAPPPPGGLPAWVHWARHEEVDELEDLYRRVADGEHQATEVDELRCIEIAARATRAMLAGEEPPA